MGSAPQTSELLAHWGSKDYVLYMPSSTFGDLLIDVIVELYVDDLWNPGYAAQFEDYLVVADNFCFNGKVLKPEIPRVYGN